MFVNWEDVNKTLIPVKSFDDCCRRLQVSYSYPFVREAFNFSLPDLTDYTKNLLGGDSRQRYTNYLANLVKVFSKLDQAGVKDLLSLVDRLSSRARFEQFVNLTGIEAVELANLLKYLLYWLVPGEKYLSGLVRQGSNVGKVILGLSNIGIKTNLQALQAGITPSGRETLATQTGLPIESIVEVVNRADFSRLPWASKATISNIIGAGYPNLAALANADPEKLYADFFRYGDSIGKNLKLGNEIENSYRIARIVPHIVK